ncbi:hypothetical protein DPEC_G00069810 [Dallia pectoralis]|uniref:Uncharacterized protein n=1 Tax=Dallia pectoralis TaxID=75939 RepID=A0ACC2H2N2_DALPE|nr:hypothetical protein DPEC_G00069810 [Dallia pectoralis]
MRKLMRLCLSVGGPLGGRSPFQLKRVKHRTNPSMHFKEDYAKGITTLFPNLADPRSKFGYDHYYNAEDGSGYLAC